MAKINLLPWRAELLVRKNTEFGVAVLLFAALGAVIVFAIMLYYNGLIETAERRNQYMLSKIAELDKKIASIKDIKKEKDRLLQRIKTIQELQSNRTEIVHLFDETVKRLPDGVYLTSMKQTGDNIAYTGVAESNTRVSEYVKNVEESDWMTDARIEVIQRNPQAALKTSDFTLRLKQSRPKSLQKNEEDS